MKLINAVQNAKHRLAAPLAGLPAVKLTKTTLQQNRFNAELQTRSLCKLAESIQPDILFTMMDLSLEAASLGLPVRYPLDESATVEHHPVKCAADLEKFKAVDPLHDGRVWVALETTRRLSRQMDIPVAAYIVSPFTLAGLMMGAGEIAMSVLDNPDQVQSILAFCEHVSLLHAEAQLNAGARILCFLDPTAAMLSPDVYREFAGKSQRNVIQQINAQTILHICGDTTHLISSMCETGVQGLSLDAAVDLRETAQRVPDDVVVIGNIDPVQVMLNGTVEIVRSAVQELTEKTRDLNNIIFSTGCDLPAETPIENVVEFVKAAQIPTG